MLLDGFLPAYDFNERHTITIHAPPGRIFRAIKELKPSEIALFRAMMAIRSLPSIVTRKGAVWLGDQQPVLDQFLASGFVLLAEEADRELVVGTIGQFWKTSSGVYRVGDAHEFQRFQQPEYAKVALNFVVTAQPGGEALLSSETRILATDVVAKRKFGRYWALIKFGSAFIRWMWLRAIKRRAEGKVGSRE